MQKVNTKEARRNISQLTDKVNAGMARMESGHRTIYRKNYASGMKKTAGRLTLTLSISFLRIIYGANNA